MKTMTKTELRTALENKNIDTRFLFPKRVVNKLVGFERMEVKEEIPDDTVIYLRCKELPNLSCFVQIYKDGNKYYIEDSTDACERICRRVYGKDNYSPMYDYDNASFCLYLANDDMREAVKIMKRRY